jgi:hypothetical protein
MAMAALLTAQTQDKTAPPVVLPDLPQPKVVIVQVPLPPLPVAPPAAEAASSFAIHHGTVYFKVGDVVVPMIGTTGCFTPKELLKGDDPRLRFEIAAPPPPPPAKP